MVSCPECSKEFSRADVLTRHRRGAHGSSTQHKRGAQKSCFRCSEKKLKCDRAIPCAACCRSQVPCNYPPLQTRPEVTSKQALSTPESWQPFMEKVPQAPQNLQFFPGSAASLLSPPTHLTSGPNDAGSYYDEPMPPRGFHNGLDLGQCDIDWFTLDIDMDVSQHPPDSSSTYLVEQDVTQYSVSDSMSSRTQDNLLSGRLDQPDLVSQIQVPEQAMAHAKFDDAEVTATTQESSVQQWPFYTLQDAEPCRSHLSPAGSPLTLQDLKHSQSLQTHVGPLERLFSEVYLPEPSILQADGLQTTVGLLKTSVENYFLHFHHILPVIHVPTFDLAKCPTVLLSAMACIGAIHNSSDLAAKEQAALFSTICERSITSLGAADSRNYLQLDFATACCLHQVYCLGSGDRQLYENADRARGHLTGALRAMGLLRPRLGVEFEIDDISRAPTSEQKNLGHDWLSWRDKELGRRLAWAFFEYDCSVCTLTSSRRGAVDISELPNKLPCIESLWEAPSAQAWAALKHHMSYTAIAADLAGTLRHILVAQIPPDDLSLYARRTCSQVLTRLLWDLKQMHMMSMTEYLGLPSLAAAQKQTKASLLDGIGRLCESLARPSSTTGLINHNVTSLIYHHSMLSASGEAIDLVTFIILNSLSPRGKDVQTSVRLAEDRLVCILANDPAGSRQVLWHAAQIVAVANAYIVVAPCEVIRIFLAYAVIIFFAKYCPPQARGFSRQPSIRLDRLYDGGLQDSAVEDWIRNGGNVGIGSAHDIYVVDAVEALVEDGKAMLQKLQPWRLASKLSRVLDDLETIDRPPSNS